MPNEKVQDFGRQPMFSERSPTLCDNLPVTRADQKNFLVRNQLESYAQNTPSYSSQQVDGARTPQYANSGLTHAEGGATNNNVAKGFKSKQKNNCNFRKEDTSSKRLMSAAEVMAVRQNNASDTYSSYFKEKPPQKNMAFKR